MSDFTFLCRGRDTNPAPRASAENHAEMAGLVQGESAVYTVRMSPPIGSALQLLQRGCSQPFDMRGAGLLSKSGDHPGTVMTNQNGAENPVFRLA